MMNPYGARRIAATSIGIVTSLLLVTSAKADPIKCKSAIALESAKLAQKRLKFLQACEDKKITGKLPPQTVCLAEPGTAKSILKAQAAFNVAIGKQCGGKDKLCGTADDDPLASIGWQIGSCPDFEASQCTNAITHCGGIASCLSCIDANAADEAASLYDANLNPATFGNAKNATNKCQRAIGREATKFFAAKSTALRACWDLENKGKISGPCPVPGDGKTQAKIDKAEQTKIKNICKACGGADKLCGQADDMTPAQIGFASTCPAVTVPGGENCGQIGALDSLQKIVDCVDCVTEYKVDCIDRAQVPGFASYPAECNPPANPPCSTVTVKSTVTYNATDFPNVSGVQVGFNYPGSLVSIPGSNSDPSVLARVDNLTGIMNGIFSAGDQDADPHNSTLSVGLLSLSATIPPGDFARAHFDCVAGQPGPSPSDFTCSVSGSTSQGGDVSGIQCSLDVTIQ